MYKPAKTSLKLPLFLIIGPLLCIILAFILTAAMTASSSQVADSNTLAPDSQLFDEPEPARPALNIVVFALGGLGLITLVPAPIFGLVILSKRLKARRNQTSNGSRV